MILVTGAGGKTGRALIRELSEVEDVCAFVHRKEQIPAAKDLGAQKVIAGDLLDQAAIRLAMQGARAAYHICPNMSPDEMIIGELVIREAKHAELEHLVYHSVLHPQTEKITHHWQKLGVEELLFESGLSFTILQPGPYMQNLLASWKSMVEDGILHVPYSVHSRFSFVDLADVAQAARCVLAEPDHVNAIYELAGTPLSHEDVAERFGHVLNRRIRAEKEEIGDWRLRAKGLSHYAAESLIRMFGYYDRWGLAGNPNVLAWILKRAPTSLDSFVQRTCRAHGAIH